MKKLTGMLVVSLLVLSIAAPSVLAKDFGSSTDFNDRFTIYYYNPMGGN